MAFAVMALHIQPYRGRKALTPSLLQKVRVTP
jgi:hypothetical protein